MTQLFDMHCHLDFADNCIEVAKECAGRIQAIDSTVIPSSYVSASGKLEPYENIRVGLGIHPWWIADGRVSKADVMRFESLVASAPIIGEIGLDFHGKRRATKTRQLEVFSRILQSVSDNGNERLIFLHAVKSYGDMFELIERYGTKTNNTCVFHWFQGTRNDFEYACALGYHFSVGMRMMSTPAGEVFAREIPDELLLTETDNPPHEGMSWSYEIWAGEILDTIRRLAELRGVSESEMGRIIERNSTSLLKGHETLLTTI